MTEGHFVHRRNDGRPPEDLWNLETALDVAFAYLPDQPYATLHDALSSAPGYLVGDGWVIVRVD